MHLSSWLQKYFHELRFPYGKNTVPKIDLDIYQA